MFYKKILVLSAVLILVGAGCNLQNTKQVEDVVVDDTQNEVVEDVEQTEQIADETEEEVEETKKIIPNENVSFRKSDDYGYYGKLELEGYMEVVKPECDPNGEYGYGMDGCPQDYANFVVVKSNSPVLFDYLKDGGSFKGEGHFQLGCYKEGISIESYNISDDVPGGSPKNVITSENKITGEQLELLENSDEDNLVRLKTERDIYTSGRGASECYSHFRDFVISEQFKLKVVEGEQTFNITANDLKFSLTAPKSWGQVVKTNFSEEDMKSSFDFEEAQKYRGFSIRFNPENLNDENLSQKYYNTGCYREKSGGSTRSRCLIPSISAVNKYWFKEGAPIYQMGVFSKVLENNDFSDVCDKLSINSEDTFSIGGEDEDYLTCEYLGNDIIKLLFSVSAFERTSYYNIYLVKTNNDELPVLKFRLDLDEYYTEGTKIMDENSLLDTPDDLKEKLDEIENVAKSVKFE